MISETVSVVTCDKCGYRHHMPLRWDRSILDALKAGGWTVVDGLTICPDCPEEREN